MDVGWQNMGAQDEECQDERCGLALPTLPGGSAAGGFLTEMSPPKTWGDAWDPRCRFTALSMLYMCVPP